MARFRSSPPGRRALRGVAAVEFALLLVPLVAFAVGTTELGRALYSYNTLVKATRNASRYLSMQSRPHGEEVARCLAVHGNTTCAGQALLPGLTGAMVRIDYEPAVMTGAGSVDLVRVRIEGYPFQSLVPGAIPDFTFGTPGTVMRQASS